MAHRFPAGFGPWAASCVAALVGVEATRQVTTNMHMEDALAGGQRASVKASEAPLPARLEQTAVDAEAVEVDYLIIGGGSAGCALSVRLSQAFPQSKTLLIEAGTHDDIPGASPPVYTAHMLIHTGHGGCATGVRREAPG